MTDQLKRAINDAKTAQTDANSINSTNASSDELHFDMSESTYKTTHTAVRKARRFAMQGLYEWLVTDRRFDTTGKLGWKDNAPHDIAARTRATNAMHTVHIGYYHEMMRDIPQQIEALDALIEQHLDREVNKLDTVEHAILLIGAYELQNRIEIPYKVVLDEAMKLNNHFGATDAHKLINAVLDRIAIELRAIEVDADTKANKRTSQKVAKKTPATAQLNKDNKTAESTADEPTASNKPRISANKTNVKRDRPSKSNTGTATKQAANKVTAKPVAAEPSVEQKPELVTDNAANIDSESDSLIATNNTVESVSKENNEIEKDKFLETTDEADIGLENSNLLSSKDKVSEESEQNDSEDNSFENDSSEAKDQP